MEENKNYVNICPIVDGTCDRTCEFPFHGLLKRAIPQPHQHIKIMCKTCGKLIAQCKCLGEPTLYDYRTCNDCLQKETNE